MARRFFLSHPYLEPLTAELPTNRGSWAWAKLSLGSPVSILLPGSKSPEAWWEITKDSFLLFSHL